MKIRSFFVSNSSTSSYILQVREQEPQDNQLTAMEVLEAIAKGVAGPYGSQDADIDFDCADLLADMKQDMQWCSGSELDDMKRRIAEIEGAPDGWRSIKFTADRSGGDMGPLLKLLEEKGFVKILDYWG